MTTRKLLNYWFKKRRTGFYLWAGVGMTVVYFWGAALGYFRSSDLSVILRRLGLAGFLVVIILFFVHLNLHSVHWFLDHFKDTDHLPKRQMALVNSFSMTLFLCLCLWALPGIAWILEPLWQAIGRWFSNRTSPENIVFPDIPMETQTMDIPDLSQLLGEVKPTPAWLVILEQLFRAAAYILIAILFAMAVRAVLRHIWAWITKPRLFDSDEKIYLTPTWSLFSGEKHKTESRPRFKARSYGEKIRRQYRKEILVLSRQKKTALSAASSPAELEATVGFAQPVLHELYEKARYGRQECTREEWEKVLRQEKM